MKKLLSIFALVVLTHHLSAQQETDNWYFGMNAGLDFNGGSPVAIQGALVSTEGTTVSSDANGVLNFYSDGVSVWDKNGVVMPNGSGLFGNVSTTVSALAIPHPGNSDLHYLFTLDEATGTNGLCYSVIDMSLQQGNGDVTLKNIPLQSNVTEKMTAVQQLGTNNVWLTTHEWGTNAFYSYLITAAGLQTTPVISNAGMVHTIDPLEQNKYGQMKFNTCGTKLALAIGYLDTVQVLDFDPATGNFSNPITLPLGDHVYGVEFSQDASMLYTTRYNTGAGFADLVQFDLTSGLEPTIIASMTTISSNTSGTNFYYALQLGNDENIYVCLSWSPYLGVISDPAIAGIGCGYDPLGIDLDPNFIGASSALGLPAFVQSYLKGEITCTPPIGIAENNFQGLTIAPNISENEFVLTNSKSEKALTITIYDMAGRLVEKINDMNDSGLQFGKNLSPSGYIVKVTDKSNSKYFRIVKI